MYTRSEVNPCKVKLLDLTTILESAGQPEKPISLWEAATINNIPRAKDIPDDMVKQNAK